MTTETSKPQLAHSRRHYGHYRFIIHQTLKPTRAVPSDPAESRCRPASKGMFALPMFMCRKHGKTLEPTRAVPSDPAVRGAVQQAKGCCLAYVHVPRARYGPTGATLLANNR